MFNVVVRYFLYLSILFRGWMSLKNQRRVLKRWLCISHVQCLKLWKMCSKVLDTWYAYIVMFVVFYVASGTLLSKKYVPVAGFSTEKAEVAFDK